MSNKIFGAIISVDKIWPPAAKAANTKYLSLSKWLAMSAALFSTHAFAAVGVMLYEAKGTNARSLMSGHAALVATQVCPDGINSVRACLPGETPGVVINRYRGLSLNSANDVEVIVIPLQHHLLATDNFLDLPIISSGEIFKHLQIQYWRKHLRDHITPYSQEGFDKAWAEYKRITPGEAISSILTLDFLGGLIPSPFPKEPTEPLAVKDPWTGELIPNGHWREAVGVQHLRDTILFATETTLDQELSLREFLVNEQKRGFNTFINNCSDMVDRALEWVFKDQNYRGRKRILDMSNVGITSPIAVATDFVRFIKSKGLSYTVQFYPMIPATRTPSAPPKSVVNGTLVVDPHHGKFAAAVRIGLLAINPVMFGISKAVDIAAGNINPTKEVNKYAQILSKDLSESSGQELKDEDKAIQKVAYFGTKACWNQAKDQFRRLVSRAVMKGYLTLEEEQQILRKGQPFKLARFFERQGLYRDLGENSLLFTRAKLLNRLQSWDFNRSEMENEIYLKFLLAAVSFDLTAWDQDRRPATDVDFDIQLLNKLSLKLGIILDESQGLSSVENCSLEQARTALKHGQRVKMAREGSGNLFKWLGKKILILFRGPNF